MSGGHGNRWTPAEDALLRNTYRPAARSNAADIAAVLGRSEPAVRQRARALGLARCAPPRWTPEDEQSLRRMCGDGLYDREIGAVLGRTASAVYDRRARLGLPNALRVQLSAAGIARLMGEHRQVVGAWIKRGWLPATRVAAAAGWRRWRVSHKAFVTFLHDERYWHIWRPERITDPRLRQVMLRARRGVRWITTGEAARIYGVDHKAVNHWITRGELRPVRRHGNWLVLESAARAFTPPARRPRDRRREHTVWTPELEAEALRLRGRMTNTEVAARLHIGRSTLERFYGRHRKSTQERERAA